MNRFFLFVLILLYEDSHSSVKSHLELELLHSSGPVLSNEVFHHYVVSESEEDVSGKGKGPTCLLVDYCDHCRIQMSIWIASATFRRCKVRGTSHRVYERRLFYTFILLIMKPLNCFSAQTSSFDTFQLSRGRSLYNFLRNVVIHLQHVLLPTEPFFHVQPSGSRLLGSSSKRNGCWSLNWRERMRFDTLRSQQKIVFHFRVSLKTMDSSRCCFSEILSHFGAQVFGRVLQQALLASQKFI